MLYVTGSKAGLTVLQNARRNADFVCKLLAICGFDAEVVPAEGKWAGEIEYCFCVNMAKDADQVTIDRIAGAIKCLCNEFDQEAIGCIITEGSADPRMYALKYSDESGWYPDTISNVGMSSDKPPEFITDWLLYTGTYFFPMSEFTGFDPVQGKTL